VSRKQAGVTSPAPGHDGAQRNKKDSRITLDCVPNVACEQWVEAVMSNSFGFGGTNLTLVFQRPR